MYVEATDDLFHIGIIVQYCKTVCWAVLFGLSTLT